MSKNEKKDTEKEKAKNPSDLLKTLLDIANESQTLDDHGSAIIGKREDKPKFEQE